MRFDSQLVQPGKTHLNTGGAASTAVTSSVKMWLAGIIIVATLLRLGSALYQGNTVVPLPGIFDQISYDGLARRVVAGYGFSFATDWWPATRAGEPTAHWSYLYTLYLTAIYALFGPQPIVARLIQAVLVGILHTWLTWRIGSRIFGPITGLISASLGAVYIYFFYYAGGVLTETFYITGILWTFDVALRLAARAKPTGPNQSSSALNGWLWLELGLAIGVTLLLRQVFLLFVPFLFLWLWWNKSEGPQESTAGWPWGNRFRWSALKGLIGAACIILLMIVPWTARNYLAFHTFVPLNTNAGFAFFWGNHPIYGTHFAPLLGTQTYHDLIPAELLALNEAEMDQALLKLGLGFIADDPVRFVLLSFSRAGEYFKFWPSSDSGLISNIARVGSFGICLPFILYGLWISAKLVRYPSHSMQRSEIILLYLFVMIYTAIHLASWALIRYRLPVDAVLLIFAALGLENLTKRTLSFRKS